MISPSEISSIMRLDNGHRHRDVDLGVVERVLKSHEPLTVSALIPILQDLQEDYGYLPEAALDRVGRALDISTARIYGVATFYNQFRLQPLGEHVFRICRGTACHVKGSAAILDSFEMELGVKAGGTTKDGRFSLETVACLGACSIAPTVMVDDKFYGRLTVNQVPRLIKGLARDARKTASTATTG